FFSSTQPLHLEELHYRSLIQEATYSSYINHHSTRLIPSILLLLATNIHQSAIANMSMLKQLTSITIRLGQPFKTANLRAQPLIQPINQNRRAFHASPRPQTTHQQKEEESRFHDRNMLDPQRNEGTQTGTDNEVAGHPSAFDPNTTRPETEVQESENESQQQGKVSNPLNVSPGNTEVSGTRPTQEGLPDRNEEKEATSGRGAARKNKEVNKPKN
ncbi:hypothetical protein AFLA70_47g003831, partial [Aspergillus flavus AF70]